MLRLKTTTPEFYLREAPPDPDRVARIETSSRPGEKRPGRGANPGERD